MREDFDPTQTYQTVRLAGNLYLFIDYRIKRSTIPEGFYLYEIADAEGEGCFARIKESVIVNFQATIIGLDPMPENPYYPKPGSWEYEGSYGDEMTLEEYLALPKEERTGKVEDMNVTEECAFLKGKSYHLTVHLSKRIEKDMEEELLEELEFSGLSDIHMSKNGNIVEIRFCSLANLRTQELVDQIEGISDEYDNYSEISWKAV